MKLLTVGSLPPEWGGPGRGGAATFHAALLTALLERREEVEVVGVLPPGPLDREVPVRAWVRPESVGRASFYEDLLDRLRPDAVLMNHVAHTVGVTHPRLGSPIPAVGVIQSWHNVVFGSSEQRQSPHEVTQEALSGLAAMVAVSDHTMETGRQLEFVYPPTVATIHNPVPPHYMGDELEVMGRERSGVLYLGSLIPRKEPGALVEAASLLDGLDVLLIGEGELEQALRDRIDALNIADRVRLAEPPPRDDHLRWVRGALLQARAMCLPSSSEGLPLAFVESLACGTPIVGFGPALREIRDELGIEVGEPIDSGTPEEIAAALERVLTTDWDRRELRQATLRSFGLDRVADRYLELLARVRTEAGGGGDSAGGSRPAAAPVRLRAEEASVVCVLGMSRSGTSVTARLLSLAGVHLGPEDELLDGDLRQLDAEGEWVLAKARDSNPQGHWEHYRLMRLNERILRQLGGSWRRPPPLPSGWTAAEGMRALRDEALAVLAESFAGHELWAWKDPRNSLTLPFWQDLLPNMRYVICLRNPVDVAVSLQRRDGIALEDGVGLWLCYLCASLVNTSGRSRLLVPYESYFENPAGTASRLARFVGRQGALDDFDAEEALTETIDPQLWRNRTAAGEATGAEWVSPEAASLFRVAELLAAIGNGADGGAERATRLNAAADLYAEGLLSLAEASTPMP